MRACALCDALTQPCIRVGESLIRRSQPLRKTHASAQALAKCVYERVFAWVVGKCNAAIGEMDAAEAATELQHMQDPSQKQKQSNFIGVLDMAGFEIMARNSFEQLWLGSQVLEYTYLPFPASTTQMNGSNSSSTSSCSCGSSASTGSRASAGRSRTTGTTCSRPLI